MKLVMSLMVVAVALVAAAMLGRYTASGSDRSYVCEQRQRQHMDSIFAPQPRGLVLDCEPR